METEMKIAKTDIFKKKFDFTADKIVVTTFSEKNLLELATQDKIFHKQYVQLIENDYMLYMHTKSSSYFIKRSKIYTIWQRKDLIQYNDLFYTIEKPVKENVCAPTRLVVVFSSLPVSANYYSPNIATRCFATDFAELSKQTIKNTIIMRIMDLNLSHGSYYLNTVNYPTFEQDIQEAIQLIIGEHQINAEDVVLYGSCKGGTGALYHSYLGNYKTVSVCPTIHLVGGSAESLDSSLFEKLKSDSILTSLKKQKNKADKEKIIIGSPIDFSDYEKYHDVLSKNTKIINIFDPLIKQQSDISENSSIEQITFINQLLLESENLKKEHEKLVELSTEIKKQDMLS